MKQYMLMAVCGDQPRPKATEPGDRHSAMQAMATWMGDLQANGQLVSQGAPLGSGGKRISGDGLVTDLSSIEMKELVTGYMIIKAEDFDHAVEIAKKSPMVTHQGIDLHVREVISVG